MIENNMAKHLTEDDVEDLLTISEEAASLSKMLLMAKTRAALIECGNKMASMNYTLLDVLTINEEKDLTDGEIK